MTRASSTSEGMSSKPMVKHCTGRALWRCIRATTVAESIPPDRKAPSGTSATICPATAADSRCSSASTAASGGPSKRAARAARISASGSQNRPCRQSSGASASMVTISPGISLRTSRHRLRGAGM